MHFHGVEWMEGSGTQEEQLYRRSNYPLYEFENGDVYGIAQQYSLIREYEVLYYISHNAFL